MSLTHALTILIKGKSTAGTATAKAISSIEKLGKVTDTLSKKFKVAAKFSLKLVAGITALGAAFVGGGVLASKYAADLEAVEKTFFAIHGDAAPQMLAALKKNSAFMLSDLQLQKQYAQAYMLTSDVMAHRLPEAYEYLSKISLATGETTEYLTDKLYRSVGRISTRWMSYIGATVETSEATLHAQEMFGKTADEISRTELQTAMLDRVLEKLKARTEELPAPLNTAKQIFTAWGVAMKDLVGVYGKHWLPITREVAKSQITIAQTAKRIISEGGALYDTMRTWSAAGTVVAESFNTILTSWVDTENKFFVHLSNFGAKMTSFAWQAFSWGANIATQLAIGLIQGASVALTAAMRAITGMLTWWLKGASPPRVAPELVEWGAAAMEEWLKGFTLASFDTLEGVQSKLDKVLGAFVGMDWLQQSEAAKIFLEITEQISEGLLNLQDTKNSLGGALDKLSEIGGGFGEHLVSFANLQIRTANASQRLTKAIKDLALAQQELVDSETHLTKVTDDFYMGLVEKSSYAELVAKKEKYEAAKLRQTQAKQSVIAAEEEKTSAEKQLTLYKKQLELQGRLIDQLVLLLQKQAELSTGIKAPTSPKSPKAPKLPGGTAPGVLEPIMPVPMFGGGVDQAFEDLKERIRVKFASLWADISATWKESNVGQTITNLQKEIEEFYLYLTTNKDLILETLGNIPKDIGERIQLIGEPIYKWMEDEIFTWALDEWKEWGNWWKTESPEIVTAMEKVGVALDPYWETTKMLGKLWGKMFVYLAKGVGKFIGGIFALVIKTIKWNIEDTFDYLRGFIELGVKLINEDIPGFIDTLSAGVDSAVIKALERCFGEPAVTYFEDTFKPALETGVQDIVNKVEEGFGNLQNFFDDDFYPELDGSTSAFQTDWSSSWGSILLTNIQTLAKMKPGLNSLSRTLRTKLTTSLSILKTSWVETVFPAIKTKTLEVWEAIKKPLSSMQEWLEDKLVTALEKFGTKFKEIFNSVKTKIYDVKTKWDSFVLAIKKFYLWLKTHIFKFNLRWPTLPDWAKFDSPMKIHTAWQDFGDYLKETTFDVNLVLPTLATSQAYPVTSSGLSTSSTHIYIERIMLDKETKNPEDIIKQLKEAAL